MKTIRRGPNGMGRLGARVLALTLALQVTGSAAAEPGAQSGTTPAGAGPRALILTPGVDYFGGDYATLKEVTLEACQTACLEDARCGAFTFNAKVGWCFLKSASADPRPFADAVSGRIRSGAAGPTSEEGLAMRTGELRFLPATEMEAARDLARRIAALNAPAQSVERLRAEAADAAAAHAPARAAELYAAALRLAPEDLQLWWHLARAAAAVQVSDWQAQQAYRQDATAAAVNAYLRARAPGERAQALAVLAAILEAREQWQPAIRALRAALTLGEDASLRADYDRLVAARGFRVIGHEVEADALNPRICIQFSEALARDRGALSDFVRVTDRTDLPIEVEARQICVDGVEHGARYGIQVRAGLPAADGEQLTKHVNLEVFVRDRSPMVRFLGRAYVLPKGGEPAIPVVSVNTDRIDAAIYRIGERGLGSAVASGRLRQQLATWDANEIAERAGESIWNGHVEVASRLNREVTTSVPVAALIGDLRPGVYAMTARPHNLLQPNDVLATQWFLVSDLGLATYAGQDGLHVLVRSLANAAAVPGVRLRLVALNDEILGEFTTDKEGYARFEPGLLRGSGGNAAALVIAEGPDGDHGFLDLTQTPFDLSDRGVTGRPAARALDTFMVTERGAYRPGERLYLTALVRDSKAEAVSGLPITVLFKRPDGVEHRRVLLEDQGLGAYRAELALGGSAMRGTWRALAYVDPKEAALAETTFLVEDFEPERLAFDLASAVTELDPADPPRIDLDAHFLFGAPAGGVAVESEVQIRLAEGLAAWPGYRFGLASEPLAPLGQPLPGMRTDALGQARIALALPELPVTSRPLQLGLSVRLVEGGGRPVERSLTLPIRASAPRIGVKPLFDGALEEGGNARFEVMLLDADGRPRAPEGLRWSLLRLQTDFQWYQRDGNWNYEPLVTTRRVASGTLAPLSGPSQAPGAAQDSRLPPEVSEAGVAGSDARGVADSPSAALVALIESKVDWGAYRLRVEAIDGAFLPVDMDFEAGWYVTPTAEDTPDGLKVSLDKPSYRVGETVKARIEAPFPGIALVMVVDDRLIEMRTLEVPEGGASVELPVTQAWGPGAYVSAALYRPMDLGARRMPGRALGVSWAGVDPAERRLAVHIERDPGAQGTAEGVVRPRQRLTIPVRVEAVSPGEAVYVTLAAVDLGILNLTRHPVPAPDAWYFGQRRLGVEIRDLYGQLIDRMQGVPGVVRSGGDGALVRLEGPPPTEELVAFQSEILRVDDQGRAFVTFEIPEFNGRLRLTAMAWSARGVGHAVEDVVVRDPVVMLASLPRFLGPGDRSRLLLNLTHVDGPSGALRLAVESSGERVRVPAGEGERVLEIAPQGSMPVSIPIEGLVVGDETLRVRLETPDGQSLSKTLRMPVRANAPEVSRSSVIELAPGAALRLDASRWSGFEPGTGRLAVSITGAGALDVAGWAMRLDRYPYGCVEQLASRALPLLYLNATLVGTDAGLGFGATPWQDGTPTPPGSRTASGEAILRESVQGAIDEVLGKQAANGSFGLWDVGGGDGWLDAYVSDFLTRAREQGYSVATPAFDLALDNLRNRLAYASDFSDGGEDVAYGLYVLARNGRAPISDLRYYAETKLDAFATPMAKAQLAAALALYADRTRAERVFQAAVRALETAREEGGWRADFGSRLRDTAALITLAAESGVDTVDLASLARDLADQTARARVTSTQDDAWLLLAAHALMQGAEKPRLGSGDQVWEGPWVSRIGPETAAVLPLVVENLGRSTQQALLSVRGIPLASEPAGGEGYRIERAYYDLDGRRADPSRLHQGARLLAVITVSADAQRQARLIVDDPLPAGLEIENPALIRAGEIADIPWLGLEETVAHTEFRGDRFIAAVDRSPHEPARFQLAYRLRAVSPGVFVHPAATVEDMYRPQRRAWSESGRVEVLETRP